MAGERPARGEGRLRPGAQKRPVPGGGLANRGVLAFETGDVEGAVRDLTRAISFGEDASLLFNRAVALRAAGREEEAVADLTRAHELAPEDDDIWHALAGESDV